MDKFTQISTERLSDRLHAVSTPLGTYVVCRHDDHGPGWQITRPGEYAPTIGTETLPAAMSAIFDIVGSA